MAAAATDLLQKVSIATATTLDAPGYTISDTSITVASTSTWPTDTGITFAIDEVDANGDRVAGSYNEYVGVVSSGTSITSVSHVNGTDKNYSAGATTRVYIPVSEERENRIVTWGTTEHTQLGVHALTTNSTITSSKVITSLNDTNGNELIKVTPTASAVNEVTLANAATGTDPSLTASGGDTNIGINLVPKGTGGVKVGGNRVWQYLGSATYTGGTVTSSGATPTLVTSLTTQVTIPAGCTAVRITVQLQNLYLQTSDSLGTLRVYSGATSGALTTVIGEMNANIGAGSVNFGVVPASLVAIQASPSAGAIYFSAAIHASASNAKTDSSATAPAWIIVECC